VMTGPCQRHWDACLAPGPRPSPTMGDTAWHRHHHHCSVAWQLPNGL